MNSFNTITTFWMKRGESIEEAESLAVLIDRKLENCDIADRWRQFRSKYFDVLANGIAICEVELGAGDLQNLFDATTRHDLPNELLVIDTWLSLAGVTENDPVYARVAQIFQKVRRIFSTRTIKESPVVQSA